MSNINVNYMGLVKALMEVKGATPATFIAVTPVKMNKKNKEKEPNPYHNLVFKRQKANVFINFDYTKSVNRARDKEGNDEEFVAKKRAWGEKVDGTPIITHNGKYYLETRFLGYEPQIEYLKENVAIDKSLFESFLPPERSTASKEHQGLEEEIIIRDIDIKNIHQITFGGDTYVRTDMEETYDQTEEA